MSSNQESIDKPDEDRRSPDSTPIEDVTTKEEESEYY